MRIKINKPNSKKRIKIQKNEKNIDKRENLVPRKINDKNTTETGRRMVCGAPSLFLQGSPLFQKCFTQKSALLK